MYLSRLTLEAHEPGGLRALLNPYATHRLVSSGFRDKPPGGPGRVLFRVELAGRSRSPTLLVQSDQRPRWEPVERQGVLTAESKVFDPQVARGQHLRFRLRANPTVRRVFSPAPEGQPKKSGKRVGVYGEEEQRSWLDAKGEKSGFRVLDCRVLDRGFQVSRRRDGSPPLRHLCVDFEGILEVSNPEAFLCALESGIGSGKAFGFGLLSVARA